MDIEEAATALYLHKGVVSDAAARLKIPELKLQRIIDRSPRLIRLHLELVALSTTRFSNKSSSLLMSLRRVGGSGRARR